MQGHTVSEGVVKSTAMKKSKRSENFELLRIVSMLMVVTLHFLSMEGMLSATAFSPKWYIAWVVEAFAFIAVNCYVILSGYFLVTSKFKLKKLVSLWLQVFFYSILLYIGALSFGKIDFTIIDFIKSMFPISGGVYWFASVYTVMYIFSPFMNKLIHSLSKRQLFICVSLMVLFFSVVPTIFGFTDVFSVNSGYSVCWFVCLYFVAAYIRLYGFPKWNGWVWFSLYVGISSLLFISKFVLKHYFDNLNKPDMSNLLYDYNSMFVFSAALCFFFAFSKVSIKSVIIKKIILWLSPLTFGVYLLHEHFAMRSIVWNEIFNISKTMTGKTSLITLVFVVLLIYIICSFIEWIRKILLKPIEDSKWLNNGCEAITSWIIGNQSTIHKKLHAESHNIGEFVGE